VDVEEVVGKHLAGDGNEVRMIGLLAALIRCPSHLCVYSARRQHLRT
jgi:hypothetical protein